MNDEETRPQNDDAEQTPEQADEENNFDLTLVPAEQPDQDESANQAEVDPEAETYDPDQSADAPAREDDVQLGDEDEAEQDNASADIVEEDEPPVEDESAKDSESDEAPQQVAAEEAVEDAEQVENSEEAADAEEVTDADEIEVSAEAQEMEDPELTDEVAAAGETEATDQAEDQDQRKPVLQNITTEQVVEALLFASDVPLPLKKIVSVVGAGSARDVRKHIETLNNRYEAHENAFRIESIAGGYKIMTLPDFNSWIRKLKKSRQESRLSQAAMETLAVVAYKQPVVRAEIEAIRGVSAGEMLNRLREMGLVKIVGRAEDVGRPMLYGTTRRFLEVFGLSSLEDLPQVEELQQPSG